MIPDEPHAVTATAAAAIPSDNSLRLPPAAPPATSGVSLTTALYGTPTTVRSGSNPLRFMASRPGSLPGDRPVPPLSSAGSGPSPLRFVAARPGSLPGGGPVPPLSSVGWD